MGRVCSKHQEFYEKECRYCEPAIGLSAALPARSLFGIDSCDLVHKRLGPAGGICHICRYDILPVAPMPLPAFKKVREPFFEKYLGAEKIGPQESKFWMDFISQEFCKADTADLSPPAFPAFTWMRIPVAPPAEQDLSETTLDRHYGCE